MAKTTSIKQTKASKARPNNKPVPRGKFFLIEPAVRFYEIEDGDNNKEGE